MASQGQAANVTGAGVVLSGRGTYRGLTLFSVAGATVTVYDNTANSGKVLAAFVLGANGDKHIDVTDGVRVDNGIYVDTAGVLVGSVRYG